MGSLPRTSAMKQDLPALAPGAAIIGGLLWIIYSILSLLRPWGPYVTAPPWPEPPAVLNAGAFAITALVGGAAILVLALAVPATVHRLNLPVQGAGRFGIAMAWVSSLSALAAAAGGLLGRAGLTAGAMTAGEVLLAFGVMLVAIDAAGSPTNGVYGSALFVVGVVGMLGLMAQALVAVAVWMLPVYGALVMAVYGLAWVRFGNWLYRHT
jgi:hypothetical protein